MTFELNINLDNAAFEENPEELENILARIAGRIDVRAPGLGSILDSNGNTVGEWRVIA